MKTTEKKNGWQRTTPFDNDGMRPGQTSGELWSFIHRTDLDTPEQRAERVAKYSALLADAEQADREGNLSKLKAVADEIRVAVGELPEDTPKYFYPEKLKYRDSLSLAEIRQRIAADVARRDLGELFGIAEAFRKEWTIQ